MVLACAIVFEKVLLRVGIPDFYFSKFFRLKEWYENSMEF